MHDVLNTIYVTSHGHCSIQTINLCWTRPILSNGASLWPLIARVAQKVKRRLTWTVSRNQPQKLFSDGLLVVREARNFDSWSNAISNLQMSGQEFPRIVQMRITCTLRVTIQRRPNGFEVSKAWLSIEHDLFKIDSESTA